MSGDKETNHHDNSQLGQVLRELRRVSDKIDAMQSDLARGQALHEQFAPIPAAVAELRTKNALLEAEVARLCSIVYGAVGLALTALVVAVLTIVVKGHP